ncbi:restriction endonuclease subunit S [Paenibacillus jamilae]|uniref:restriction endonuclease subunit S n=1 Tax=Paenibacillus jamilae TaxID=114136 RepID=UPI003D29480B
MIKPKFMEKLLEGVEVEWKTLGDVAELYGGLSGKKKEDFGNGNALYISYKNIFDNIEINSDKLESVKVSDSENQHEVKYGDILFTGSSETAEEAGMSSSVTTKFEDKVYLNSFSFGVRFKDDILMIPQFSKYLFRSHFMRTEIAKTASGVTRFNISKARFKKIPIPIPPIKVQEEIVRILDAFTGLATELTAELTAELTSRKKQYAYYRDKLLTFDEGEVEWKTLGDVTLPTSNIRWRDTTDTYRYIDLTSVSREKHTIIETIEISAENAPSRAQKLVIKNDVIFATTRPTQQRLCLITKEFSGGVASSGYCILRAQNNEVLPKWIYYCITSSKFKNYVEENQSGSAYPAISDAKVKNFKIPTPPLTEQERIVAILDKFNELKASITEGLPHEIELRQKQYEYYCNMLLSFPKEEVEA